MLIPKRKIVISLHGIRTRGTWQKQIASVISENGWIYYPLDYGYFTALHFALPWVRRARIKWFCQEFDQIQDRYPGSTPSVIAHSNGSYIVANALKCFSHIRLDKLILCGSIVRPDFDWKTLFDRKQLTAVRNEIGAKDIWSKNVHRLAWFDTGPSGQRGFCKEHDRLRQPKFSEFDHSTFQAIGHYRSNWLPFLDESIPLVGEEDPPWYSEEPVSPTDAARWSAMTYFYQYVRRMHEAIVNGEAIPLEGGEPLPAKGLCILIPRTPGRAAKDATNAFYAKHALKRGRIKDGRTFQFNRGEILYDMPTTLNTLGFLDNRTDEELDEAVDEFVRLLARLISGSRSNCADHVSIKRIEEIREQLL